MPCPGVVSHQPEGNIVSYCHFRATRLQADLEKGIYKMTKPGCIQVLESSCNLKTKASTDFDSIMFPSI